MNKLDTAKKIIKTYYNYGDCGLFDTRNIVGDAMTTIYDNEGLTIDICYNWAYFEVFGLNHAEFEELAKYYNSLWGKKE